MRTIRAVCPSAGMLMQATISIGAAEKVRHGMAEARGDISFGVPIKHAYIITSAREQSPKSRAHNPLNSGLQQAGSPSWYCVPQIPRQFGAGEHVVFPRDTSAPSSARPAPDKTL